MLSCPGRNRGMRKRYLPPAIPALAAAGVLLLLPVPGNTGPAAEPEPVSIELNKLEPQGKNCRAYIVVSNTANTAYSVFKLDLVMFNPDGIIGQRFAIDLAPIRPSKRAVKLFDLSGTSCEQVGTFLVNDVLECRGEGPERPEKPGPGAKAEKAEPGQLHDCLARLKTSSLAKAQFTK